MPASKILQHLKDHGQLLDSELANATGMTLRDVRTALMALSVRGEIMMCGVTRFGDGKPIYGALVRIAGTVPPTGPGRKPGVQS